MAGPFKHIKSFASEDIGVFGMFFGKAVAEGGCEELWLGAAEISPAGGLGDAGRWAPSWFHFGYGWFRIRSLQRCFHCFQLAMSGARNPRDHRVHAGHQFSPLTLTQNPHPQ